jgi:CBS domain containing-hemolysin-like protein
MQRTGSHLGHVTTEGNSIGVITMEDVLTQLIGDINEGGNPKPD